MFFSRTEKTDKFCSLMHGSGDRESFVFFTDPHLLVKTGEADALLYERFESYMNGLSHVFYSIPADFVIGGGDWLGNRDTIPEAKAKLGSIDGYMRYRFGDAYYPILGNHDSNYQGIDENGQQLGVNRGLSPEAETELTFRRFGHPYYSFRGRHTSFYILDSQLDWNADQMNPYKGEQLRWLAGELIKDDADHSVIALHMWWWYRFDSEPAALTAQLTGLITAYNGKKVWELNGERFDFSRTSGRIEFVMSGHTHADWFMKIGDCPVFSTTEMRQDGVPTYDLMYADYEGKLLHCIRMGSGSDRTFDLNSGDPVSV